MAQHFTIGLQTVRDIKRKEAELDRYTRYPMDPLSPLTGNPSNIYIHYQFENYTNKLFQYLKFKKKKLKFGRKE